MIPFLRGYAPAEPANAMIRTHPHFLTGSPGGMFPDLFSAAFFGCLFSFFPLAFPDF